MVALRGLTSRAITSGTNLAGREGRDRLFLRDKACFESKGSQLRTHYASKACTEFDLQIGRDSSWKSISAGSIDHHACADPQRNCFQRLLWPSSPSFGEAAVARRPTQRRPAYFVQHTMRRQPFWMIPQGHSAAACQASLLRHTGRNAGRRSNFNRGSGRDPMDPFCWQTGARTTGRVQIVRVCRSCRYAQPSTFSSAGPLPGAKARFAHALDEPVSLRSRSHSLLRLY